MTAGLEHYHLTGDPSQCSREELISLLWAHSNWVVDLQFTLWMAIFEARDAGRLSPEGFDRWAGIVNAVMHRACSKIGCIGTGAEFRAQ